VRLGVKKRQVNTNWRRGREAKKKEKEIRCFSLSLSWTVSLQTHLSLPHLFLLPLLFTPTQTNEDAAASALAFAPSFLNTHHFFLLIPSPLISFFYFPFGPPSYLLLCFSLLLPSSLSPPSPSHGCSSSIPLQCTLPKLQVCIFFSIQFFNPSFHLLLHNTMILF